MAIALMMQHAKETLSHGSKGNPNFRAEAVFYCSEHDYDYKKAKAAFDADVQFEREAAKANKRKKFLGLF